MKETHASDPPRSAQARRADLLKHLQLLILASFAVAFVAVFAGGPHPSRATYFLLIASLTASMSVSLGLNLAGHFQQAAALTIIIASFPPWYSLAFDPAVLAGDLIPMVYVVFPVMLSAMLMSIRTVIVVSAVQVVGLALVSTLGPNTGANWASLLTLVFLITVISSAHAVVTRHDLAQIHDQVLRLNEAQADLRHQSTHDALTGLFNRRFLEELLDHEVAVAHRQGHPLGVMMLDVDNFKLINDALGHARGDDALGQVARSITQQIRRSDTACRYGGDEFVVVLPDADLEDTTATAERILAAIPSLWLAEGGPDLRVSIGIAVFPDHGTTAHDLVGAADAALYRAKAGGRDQVLSSADRQLLPRDADRAVAVVT